MTINNNQIKIIPNGIGNGNKQHNHVKVNKNYNNQII